LRDIQVVNRWSTYAWKSSDPGNPCMTLSQTKLYLNHRHPVTTEARKPRKRSVTQSLSHKGIMYLVTILHLYLQERPAGVSCSMYAMSVYSFGHKTHPTFMTIGIVSRFGPVSGNKRERKEKYISHAAKTIRYNSEQVHHLKYSKVSSLTKRDMVHGHDMSCPCTDMST